MSGGVQADLISSFDLDAVDHPGFRRLLEGGRRMRKAMKMDRQAWLVALALFSFADPETHATIPVTEDEIAERANAIEAALADRRRVS